MSYADFELASLGDQLTTSKFDVFLSHNSKQKEVVGQLLRELKKLELVVWYDEEQLRPGVPWMQLLEEGINNSNSVAVLVGSDGLGPWENEEMHAALALAVKNKRPVIPVLLPDCATEPKLPMFLENRTWVDMRGGFTKKTLQNLKWGVTGNRQMSQDGRLAETRPSTTAMIEFTLDRPIDDFNESADSTEGKAAEIDRKWQGARTALKALVTEILQADPTRRLVLAANQLPRDLSPEALAEKIFSIEPEFRFPEEYHTPMCFLHRCCDTALADKERDAILNHLDRLAAILAPISFHADESAEIQQMIDKVTQHAQVASQKPMVGASLVAAYLGLEVDLNHRETIEAEGNLKYDGNVIRSKRKVHASLLLPFDSIDNNGMVDAVARGLAPQVGASDPTVQSVRVRLSFLAREKSYICLWFNRALDSSAVKLLKEAFPELIILVSHSQQESLINTTVYEQLRDLQKFIEANND